MNQITSEKIKKIIIAAVVVIAAIAIGVFIFIQRGYKQATPGLGTIQTPAGSVEGTMTPLGIVAAPGASAVSTSTGQVVTESGQAAQNSAVPGTPEAPKESSAISSGQLPGTAIKLTVTASGWTPNQFTARAGAPVTLSITSGDALTHIFMFNDPGLSAVAVGVGPGETRLITFNAPSAKGDYSFRCDVPGHAARGETGKMTVQ